MPGQLRPGAHHGAALKYEPRPPQRVITKAILKRRRLNVWAGMGFGKTGATLDALDTLELVEDGPTLVIGRCGSPR